ncbi:MAG TPA: hypothetical protein VE403_08820 [Sphingomicrobium sp.]|nr:hypothetical protein [Sphingomicrobium sp.]
MASFLGAHGYDPGPTQRPLLAGALSGLLATAPAIALLYAFGSLQVEARILGLGVLATLLAGWPLMALAGAVMVLPIASGGKAPAGTAALGVFLSLVLWGAALGAILPFVHRPFHRNLEDAAQGAESGPSAATRGHHWGSKI